MSRFLKSIHPFNPSPCTYLLLFLVIDLEEKSPVVKEEIVSTTQSGTTECNKQDKLGKTQSDSVITNTVKQKDSGDKANLSMKIESTEMCTGLSSPQSVTPNTSGDGDTKPKKQKPRKDGEESDDDPEQTK